MGKLSPVAGRIRRQEAQEGWISFGALGQRRPARLHRARELPVESVLVIRSTGSTSVDAP
jgi:hypothetical protein